MSYHWLVIDDLRGIICEKLSHPVTKWLNNTLTGDIQVDKGQIKETTN